MSSAHRACRADDGVLATWSQATPITRSARRGCAVSSPHASGSSSCDEVAVTSGLLVRAQGGQRRLGAAVLVSTVAFESVETGTCLFVEHRDRAVVVTGEPAPCTGDRRQPRGIAGHR